MTSSIEGCGRQAYPEIVEICVQTAEFLLHQQERAQKGQEIHASCRIEAGPALTLVQSLECGLSLGIDLVATARVPKIVTLQTFYDPDRFRVWAKSVSAASQFHVVLFGFHVWKQGEQWALGTAGVTHTLCPGSDCPRSLDIFKVEDKRVYRLRSPAEVFPSNRILPSPTEGPEPLANQSSRLLEVLG